MRPIAALLTVVALAAAPAVVRASQSGGLAVPLGPGKFALSATVGYGERDVEDGRGDEVTSRRMLFRGQIGVLDGLDLYATLGFGDLEFDRVDFQGSLGEDLGIGLRYGLLNFPEQSMKLVTDLQAEYLRSEDGSRKVERMGYHAALYLVREMGAAGRVGYFYPFGGLRFSYAHYELNQGIDDYSSDNFLGVFGGADYFVTPNVFFSGELHLFDENGLYLGVGYRF
jgi:hypothetical protein